METTKYNKHRRPRRAHLGVAITAVAGLWCLNAKRGPRGGIQYSTRRRTSSVMGLDRRLKEEYAGILAIPESLMDSAGDMAFLASTLADVAAASLANAPAPYSHHSSSVPPFALEDLVAASHNYEKSYALMVYDPPTDQFILVHDGGRMEWSSSSIKLRQSFDALAFLLRQIMPERFQGEGSNELVLGIGSGDYPHLSNRCLETFPDPNEKNGCGRSEVPVLQFGSVFQSREIFPNAIAMPMPEPNHLGCFMHYAEEQEVCPGVRDSMVYLDELGLEFEDLITQVVWRGTDFPYLMRQNSLNRPVPTQDAGTGEVEFEVTERTTLADAYVSPIPEFMSRGQTNTHHRYPVVATSKDPLKKKRSAAYALAAASDKLFPRWNGVALTTAAEVAAEDENRAIASATAGSLVEGDGEGEAVLPWANMKFTLIHSEREGKDETAKMEDAARLLDEYGVPYKGEPMSHGELAQYKYHIDIGGGGGTTWTGTMAKLAMPGLLFHHITPTKDYIHDRMVPWVHYVPIAPDLSDLKEKFDWAEANPQAAKLIAAQGTQLVRDLGTDEGFGALFHDHIVGPLHAVVEAYLPLSKSARPDHLSTWRDVLREFQDGDAGHEYNAAWRCTGEHRHECARKETTVDCTNDKTWKTFSRTRAGKLNLKTCNWVANSHLTQSHGRCDSIGTHGTPAYEACPLDCNQECDIFI